LDQAVTDAGGDAVLLAVERRSWLVGLPPRDPVVEELTAIEYKGVACAARTCCKGSHMNNSDNEGRPIDLICRLETGAPAMATRRPARVRMKGRVPARRTGSASPAAPDRAAADGARTILLSIRHRVSSGWAAGHLRLAAAALRCGPALRHACVRTVVAHRALSFAHRSRRGVANLTHWASVTLAVQSFPLSSVIEQPVRMTTLRPTRCPPRPATWSNPK